MHRKGSTSIMRLQTINKSFGKTQSRIVIKDWKIIILNVAKKNNWIPPWMWMKRFSVHFFTFCDCNTTSTIHLFYFGVLRLFCVVFWFAQRSQIKERCSKRCASSKKKLKTEESSSLSTPTILRKSVGYKWISYYPRCIEVWGSIPYVNPQLDVSFNLSIMVV